METLKQIFVYLIIASVLAPASNAGVRIKDLTMVMGARENQLIGYGIVSGLAGDGDKNIVFTFQGIANMLQRFDVSVPPSTMSAKNAAAVMVTAEIPAFSKSGARLDVTVSAVGDAKSLQGGVLLQTPLIGADGKVYAVAQGPIAVGGFSAGTGGGGGASVQKNHPTTGQIIGGALVEREIPSTIVRGDYIELLLREPDFTTAARMAEAISGKFDGSAKAMDSATVRVTIPDILKDSIVEFIARVESVEVIPDVPARIVINERTGTVVANSRIQISNCAVSHGNLTISVASTLDVSQPSPLSQTGQTAVTPRTETSVTESNTAMVSLPKMPTIDEVAKGLNTLGVTPRDMMAIFQAMKQAGALQAELILR
ncbi:MAG: flagellar basal body P-ring protein FlgI [Verrucomicrobia bacterium]|nr:flagellar basal body P-ring protein FlgI [Verrucomicrobiota bacterium]